MTPGLSRTIEHPTPHVAALHGDIDAEIPGLARRIPAISGILSIMKRLPA
jgi:hypothetical protein